MLKITALFFATLVTPALAAEAVSDVTRTRDQWTEWFLNSYESKGLRQLPGQSASIPAAIRICLDRAMLNKTAYVGQEARYMSGQDVPISQPQLTAVDVCVVMDFGFRLK